MKTDDSLWRKAERGDDDMKKGYAESHEIIWNLSVFKKYCCFLKQCKSISTGLIPTDGQQKGF